MKSGDSMIRLNKKHMVEAVYASVICGHKDILVLVDTKLNQIRTRRVLKQRIFDEMLPKEIRRHGSIGRGQSYVQINDTRIYVEIAPRDLVNANNFAGYEFKNIILYRCEHLRDDVYSYLEARIR